jgi:hypothetical protein
MSDQLPPAPTRYSGRESEKEMLELPPASPSDGPEKGAAAPAAAMSWKVTLAMLAAAAV